MSTPAPRRAALYVRVSTDDQTTANQLPELRLLAERRGFPEAVVYEEVVSGAAPRRPALEQLLDDARRGALSAVFVWALDRLTRRGISELHHLLEQLQRYGVVLVSAREPWLDTAGPVAPLLVSIFGWVAQQERLRLADRTRAGLARAKGQGKRLGRRPVPDAVLAHALSLVAAGSSVRAAAKATPRGRCGHSRCRACTAGTLHGVTEGSLRRALAARRPRPEGGEGGSPPPASPRV